MFIPERIGELESRSVIQLDDITQLPTFEDMVAEEIDPTATQNMRDAWLGRVALGDLIRPSKFNGTVSDIELVVMDEPYERLFDANERGWSFMRGRGSGTPTKRGNNDRMSETYHGFTFVATARSSGRGAIGQIQTELWYGGVATDTRSRTRQLKSGEVKTYSGEYKKSYNYGGSSIRRYVTKPRMEKEAFIELDNTSKKIGFAVLRQNMQNPLVQPIG